MAFIKMTPIAYTFVFIIFILILKSKAETWDKKLRLIGAQPAEAGEFRWTVSLQKQKLKSMEFKHFCAGSIVDPTHVITAAHCVWNKSNKTINAIAGSLNISSVEGGQSVTVSKIHIHPQYKSENRAGPFDIAVLEVSSSFTFNDHVGAISLPDPNEPAKGDCKYAGWGNRFLISGIYYHASDVLRTISSRVIPKFLCMASYLFVFRRQLDTAICTAAGPLRGSCQGDSGGSLVCLKDDKTPFLAGVVSWGWIVCGDGFHPDVATDVSLFIDFIKEFLQPNTI